MVIKFCKCSEDVKCEFYDFVYYGFWVEYNDLMYWVDELILVEKEMIGEE